METVKSSIRPPAEGHSEMLQNKWPWNKSINLQANRGTIQPWQMLSLYNTIWVCRGLFHTRANEFNSGCYIKENDTAGVSVLPEDQLWHRKIRNLQHWMWVIECWAWHPVPLGSEWSVAWVELFQGLPFLSSPWEEFNLCTWVSLLALGSHAGSLQWLEPRPVLWLVPLSPFSTRSRSCSQYL